MKKSSPRVSQRPGLRTLPIKMMPASRTIDDAKLFRLNFEFDGEGVDLPPRAKSTIRPASPIRERTPQQWGNEDLKATAIQSKRPIYSVKYFGVTDGDFGVLTRKRLMPVISPLEVCNNTPFAVLSAVKRKRTGKVINSTVAGKKLVPSRTPEPERTPLSADISPMADTLVPEEYLRPVPAKYNHHLVHTYARPRGLIKPEGSDTLTRCAAFCEVHIDTEEKKYTPEMQEYMARYEAARKQVYQITLQRRDIRGWKLTQPRTPRKANEAEEGLSVFKPPALA